MSEPWQTDEDRMIERLTVHRNVITWLLERLAAQGINAARTKGNDPCGDIVFLDPDDVPRVQQMIRALQAEENP